MKIGFDGWKKTSKLGCIRYIQSSIDRTIGTIRRFNFHSFAFCVHGALKNFPIKSQILYKVIKFFFFFPSETQKWMNGKGKKERSTSEYQMMKYAVDWFLSNGKSEKPFLCWTKFYYQSVDAKFSSLLSSPQHFSETSTKMRWMRFLGCKRRFDSHD